MFTIRSGRLYVCLSDSILDSLPSRCSEREFGVEDQPKLVGKVATHFVAEAGGDGTYYANAEVWSDQLVRYSNLKVEWRPTEG